ncbi:MAG: hypothetical protein ACO3JL_10350 [Myxococcota bacterium]
MQPFPLPLLACTPIADRHTLLRLDPRDTPFREAHVAPGQVALLGFQPEATFPMAIASVPGDEVVEVLMASKTESDQQALLSREGPLYCGGPKGPGFPLARARGRSLWLFAGGSAISGLRAVIETLLRERDAYGEVRLLYGAKTDDLVCFRDSFARWQAAGIEVQVALSRHSDPGAAKRYVQELLPAELDGAGEMLAFVCGRPAMEQAVTEALLARGVDAGAICKNWP